MSDLCEHPKSHVILTETKVLDTTFGGSTMAVRRRRECYHCKFRWTTWEVWESEIRDWEFYAASTKEAAVRSARQAVMADVAPLIARATKSS